jgi:hypothetical protein
MEHTMAKPRIKGPWSQAAIDRFLAQARMPIRLSVCSAEGYPCVVSLWFMAAGESLLCITHRDSALAQLLQRDGKVGFEISPNEPPYFGLRGSGDCSLTPLPDRATFERLIERYLDDDNQTLASWLLARSEEELLLTITPRQWFSWDYRRRMASPTPA